MVGGRSGTTANLRVWSASADATWTVGPTPTVLRWDGLSWTDDAPAVEWTPQDVWGTGPDDVWAVGGPGLVLHRSGGTWTEEPTGVVMGGRFFGVWGDPGVKVFTVGENSMIRDRELPAGSWNTRLPPEWMDLFAVGGASADLVWAVGGVGNILRGPGATWVRVGGTTTNDLRGVWALSSDAAWAVGDGGTIVQWNGAVWQEEESGTTAGLKERVGAPGRRLWAVSPARSFAGASEPRPRAPSPSRTTAAAPPDPDTRTSARSPPTRRRGRSSRPSRSRPTSRGRRRRGTRAAGCRSFRRITSSARPERGRAPGPRSTSGRRPDDRDRPARPLLPGAR